MKNVLFGLIALLLMLSAGCNPDLEPVSYDEINPSIFPTSESDVEALVAAAYYPLRGSWWDGIHTTSENGLAFILDSSTEILMGQYGIQEAGTYHSWTPDEEGATRPYDMFYNKLSSMTLSIDRIEKSDAIESVKTTAIAEIRCARGFLAYELFDMYGPIVIAPLEVLLNPLQEEPLARLPYNEMVRFIEQDLLAAAKDLKTPSETPYGRFSQGMARMILIRLYLHEKRWVEVEEQANAIMAMGHYQLEEDYVGLWNLNGATDSKEVIFSIPSDYAGTSENQWQLMVLPSNYPDGAGWGTVQSSWAFYDSFEPNDVRKTNLIAEYTGTDGITYNRENPGDFIQLGPLALKINPDADREGEFTTVDIILYRYADVILSKAEAIANKSGGPNQEAIDLVNQIRTRAQIPLVTLGGYPDLESFNTLILLERSHEYWCENGQYRSDLIRHGKFTEYNKDLVGPLSESNKNKEVFPFSFERVNEGKGKFLQNPGYTN